MSRRECICGSTPPLGTITCGVNWLSSSSLRMASTMERGLILRFLMSRAALPLNSSTSATKYSRTAAKYTGAPAAMRLEYLPWRKYLCIRLTGNCRPALAVRLTPEPVSWNFFFDLPTTLLLLWEDTILPIIWVGPIPSDNKQQRLNR